MRPISGITDQSSSSYLFAMVSSNMALQHRWLPDTSDRQVLQTDTQNGIECSVGPKNIPDFQLLICPNDCPKESVSKCMADTKASSASSVPLGASDRTTTTGIDL